jgi:hypothetical protein
VEAQLGQRFTTREAKIADGEVAGNRRRIWLSVGCDREADRQAQHARQRRQELIRHHIYSHTRQNSHFTPTRMQGRIFQVTPRGEIVWEYVSPHFGKLDILENEADVQTNWVYRAQPVPYDWVPEGVPRSEQPVTREHAAVLDPCTAPDRHHS